MADKVQLIKEKIERLDEKYRELRVNGTTQQAKEADLCVHVLQQLNNFIDSLPEEPSVKGITWEDVNMLESLIYQVHNEYPHGIGEKSFGLEVLERFQGCQDDVEEHDEDLEEAMEMSVSEEPLLEFFATGQPTIGAYNEDSLRNQFEAGAEWQKQKDQETIELAEDHAMMAGMNRMKEKMIKDAVLETKVIVDCDGDGIETPYEEWLTLENTEIPYIPDNLGLKDGDKVKIIVIKTE